MENEFEYLCDTGDHGGHLAEKFLKKYSSYPQVIAFTVSRFSCRY